MKKVLTGFIVSIILLIIIIMFYNYINSRIDKEILRIEVLNGTQINGLATKISKILQNNKLDVIIVSNAKFDTISQTIVIDRMKENATYAKFVAKKLKCNNITAIVDSSLYIDVTVIIGNDYKIFFKE